MAVRNIARERLERDELSLGVGVRVVRGVEIAKAMSSAGFDWLFIDLEHGILSIETASQIALAALDAGIAPIVRIANGEFSIATRLLDNGALGIVVPHVETAEEAREVAARLRYPPQGHRGVFSILPQYDFKAMNVAHMTAALNATNLVVVMLESRKAIENADAIAAVPGIDVLLIGTNDLCVEMGIPGDLGHADVAHAYARMIAACGAHGKWPGMGGVYDEALMRRYIDMGSRFVLAGGDLGFLMSGAETRTTFLRGIERSPGGGHGRA
jgi:2-keto-3-deoxy-L-rhamnonate aldolase RhmA